MYALQKPGKELLRPHFLFICSLHIIECLLHNPLCQQLPPLSSGSVGVGWVLYVASSLVSVLSSHVTEIPLFPQGQAQDAGHFIQLPSSSSKNNQQELASPRLSIEYKSSPRNVPSDIVKSTSKADIPSRIDECQAWAEKTLREVAGIGPMLTALIPEELTHCPCPDSPSPSK